MAIEMFKIVLKWHVFLLIIIWISFKEENKKMAKKNQNFRHIVGNRSLSRCDATLMAMEKEKFLITQTLI